MHSYLLAILECPACHSELAWTFAERRGDRIETAEARCKACDAVYPVREGIGLFLTPDLPRDDLWEQVDSQLTQHLREHPEVERQLMDAPLETLTPTDQMYHAMVLDERGEYDQAKVASDLATQGLYSPERLACSDSQVNYVIEHLSASSGPVVDLASGLGRLVEEAARKLSRPIVATDFSPSVLRRDRRCLEFFGLYDQVSLLAFDARRTPFRDGAVETLTTYQGLPNIREPGDVLRELRRVVRGVFLAVSLFYPEDDEANLEVIREAKLETLLLRRTALECFDAAGWQVEVVNARHVKASPTPPSALFAGATVDGLPVSDTTLEYCVLLARGRD